MYTLQEVADRFDINKYCLYKLVSAGKIPYRRKGKDYPIFFDEKHIPKIRKAVSKRRRYIKI